MRNGLGKKFRIVLDSTEITCPSSYVELYRYEGSGWLHGGIWDFNSDYVRIKLEVDNEIVLEMTLEDLEDIRKSGNDIDLGMITIGSSNRFILNLPSPIQYNSHVVVWAQQSKSGGTKRLDRQLVYITKGT